MKKIPISRGLHVLVDDADYEFLMQWKWSACGEHPIYAVRGYRVGRKTCPVKMHRQILGAPEGWIVDHINGNSLDNRKANLRLATPNQNAQNRRVRNRLGFRGVYPEGKKFRAYIQGNGRRVNLGIFTDPAEAARAYDAAARKMHKAYAVLNFLDEPEAK